MEGLNIEKPYIDPQLESLFERIYPASVCVDNDSCENCTVVKVDSANKHGILLEMVQVLSDLDLLIAKSYICSDGGWFMDVFHVTDKSENKITDESVILYIQQALCATRWKSRVAPELDPGKDVKPPKASTMGTALEITAFDKPGLLSEVSAVLAGLGCHITSAVAWTHNGRAACIIYMEEKLKGEPIIMDRTHLTNMQEQLENVVKARHDSEEMWSVRLITPTVGEKMHTERRLHQLMVGDVDCETCRSYSTCLTVVSIDTCKEKGYSVINVRSRDRPKLLFDTVCALTDMDYDVFHASIRSKLSIAFQEYYIRHKDGNLLSSEDKRHKLVQCLIAAVERRASQGIRLDVSATDRIGLLSDVTRVLGECGLSVSKAEVSVRGEMATGAFCVKGASGQEVNFQEIIKTMKKEVDATVQVATESPEISSPDETAQVATESPDISSQASNSITSISTGNKIDERPALFSIGGLIWSRLESLSRSFVPLGL